MQGEKVKKLDQWGNQVFLDAFEHGYPVCSLISEEMDEPHHYSVSCRDNSYCILYDPIDGSSNTDVNGSLGTIFAVKKRAAGHSKGIDDILVPGSQQLIAGYILYGPATQLVYTAGAGVDIFTLDRTLGEFILWKENVKMPPHGSTYAVNQANAGKWNEGARKFLAHITSRKDKRTSHSLRYCGAFAADFHRCILEGGIYMYPGEVAEGGKAKGKLRLMYELALCRCSRSKPAGADRPARVESSISLRLRSTSGIRFTSAARRKSRWPNLSTSKAEAARSSQWMGSFWPAMSVERKLI